MTEERTRTTEREHDKLLVDTAVTAGEIMLVSGAEIYRVEDTVGRILSIEPDRKAENVALGTSLIVTLDRPGKPDGNAPDPEPVCQSESGMQSQ